MSEGRAQGHTVQPVLEDGVDMPVRAGADCEGARQAALEPAAPAAGSDKQPDRAVALLGSGRSARITATSRPLRADGLAQCAAARRPFQVVLMGWACGPAGGLPAGLSARRMGGDALPRWKISTIAA